MATGHQRIGKRNLGHLRKNETQEPLIKGLLSTTKEAAHQIVAVATAEAHTHSDLRISCSLIVNPTIAQKIAPYSSSPREKWTRSPTNLHNKRHPEKSTTPCNGLAPHHQQYSMFYPSHFPSQAYQNSHAQALAYYQSYHYATTNHTQPSPTPQKTYPLAVPQITYPMPSNTNPQVKAEANPPPPPLPQI
jgi:hypothetical protein